MLFGKSKNVIGLDIGTSSVKAVVLKPTKKGYKLLKLGIKPLPSEAIVDGAIMNASAVADTILELVAELKIKEKEVATSVSGHSVIIKKINLPFMDSEQLQESIKYEAEQYVPFDINDVNLDFQILSREPDEGGNMDVLLVAAKRDLINDYTAVVAEAGLNAAIIDIDAFTLENMYEVNYEINEGEIVALVNIGAAVTTINVVQSGVSVFTRDVATGGNILTEEIQKQLNVSYEEAETLKVGKRADEAGDEVIPQEVSNIINTVVDQVVGDVQKSIDFFLATAADQAISKVYLAGGSCKIPGLARALQERINIPVELANPFNSVQFDEKEYSTEYLAEVGPQAAVAVGLAVRRVGDK
ncbi:MAG: type IV pilus assembly protein PilM [Chrysiogenetes bacterium]|nr:type IV pilus assembly protein PilM [Chrysiogenetes bacterium]